MDLLFRFLYSFRNNTSYVRNWALQYLKNAQQIDQQVLFGGIVYWISIFGNTHITIDKYKDVPKDKKKYYYKPYSGDSTIFEVACYTYIFLDVWFVRNKIELRSTYILFFYNSFIQLFSVALAQDQNYIQSLFNERIIKYAEFFQKTDTVEETMYYLTEIIYRTKYNTLPEHIDFENFVPSLYLDLNLAEKAHLTHSVFLYESEVLPSLTKMIETHIHDNEV